ncbi:hypothetical protein EIL87_07980 [Saccharopolyspora rhizosphaerae]|uniref:C2H2-type domain-containing protein n=1 Tax=Saccharopolyspora rhizosphaerae TaxID=2492662 RepID=A0A426JY98_9PSEU|nr:hypothetical protein [Saccharopolyspora rhizosphaerae]RRO18175.1 hypothetical protein EIL87_07980 [Saccharopolyspora rhizosphaerae]
MSPPSSFPQCELCGGTFVGGLALTSHHEVGVHPRRKTQWLPMSGLSAVVCLGCGNAKFFASQLDKLRKHAQKRPDHFDW